MTDRFDPNDPEIVALMQRKATAQTRTLIENDERLQRDPNFDPYRMLEVSRAKDPTSILDDEDDYARIRPAFPQRTMTIPLAAIDPAAFRTLFGFPDPPTDPPVPGSLAAALAEFSAAMEKLAEQIRSVLVDVGHHFSDLQARIVKLGVLDDDETARLRHGHASTCPRHGPTKGGLCRRCSR